MTRITKLGLAGASAIVLAVLGAYGTAQAADAVEPGPILNAPTLDTVSPWQIRLRALGVITQNEGRIDQDPASDLSYSDTIVPELDITYYFTDNVAAELILGTTYANIRGTAGVVDGANVGKVWLLPPTLTLQYHFTNFGAFKPYVGAGVNYTIFYNQSARDVNHLDVKNAWGGALQVGFDYMLDQHWGLNLDVKKLFLEPKFEVNNGTYTGKAKLNPWLIGAGVTYRF